MIKVTGEWAGGDKLEANSMPPSVLLDSPMFFTAIPHTDSGMLGEKVVMNQQVNHLTLLLAVDLSRDS